MLLRYILPTLILLCSLCGTSHAADRISAGGDVYVSGGIAVLSEASSRDAFLSGFSVDVDGRVEKDVHAAGFDVDIDAPVGGDAYAAGFSVEFAGPVGDDLTAAAFNMLVRNKAAIGGNARLTAVTLVIDAPIAGSLTAASRDLTINGVITGDAVLTVESLKFGNGAKINGTLTYYARNPIAIPALVIAPDRVRFEKLEVSKAVETMRETGDRSMSWFWPAFLSVFAAFVLLIAFLVAVGAVLLAFASERMELWKSEALAAPVKTIALGVLGLSMSVGLIPVSGMTLIGIPLIPIAVLLVLALWVIGYLIGAYSLGARVAGAFRQGSVSMAGKFFLLAAVIIVLVLLNFIPFIGWLTNLAVLFLGLGAIVMQAARYLCREEPHVSQSVTINPTITATQPEPEVRTRKTRR